MPEDAFHHARVFDQREQPQPATTARTVEHVHPKRAPQSARPTASRGGRDTEYPLTVREAARFLGVSSQTVYLWVERRQIPHLRVMGRNIRFLKSDLEPFRSRFKQEVEDGTTT
jgi:excisionase family DNA binding protein